MSPFESAHCPLLPVPLGVLRVCYFSIFTASVLYMCMYVYVMCVYVHVCICACVYMCVCVCVGFSVFGDGVTIRKRILPITAAGRVACTLNAIIYFGFSHSCVYVRVCTCFFFRVFVRDCTWLVCLLLLYYSAP